jgi:hypothetical protein
VSQQLNSGGVEAVALGADGRSFWSTLDARGDFKLTLPAGQSYRIVLAKRGADGKPEAVAQLALTSASGKTQWVTAKAGAVLRLGDLVPAGTLTSAPAATSGIKTASGHGGTMESGGSTTGSSGSTAGSSGSTGGSHEADDASEHDGSGQAGAQESGDDSDEAAKDDKEHEDDAESHEGDDEDGHICGASSSPEMESSRNGAGDVNESCDFSKHEDRGDSCGGGGAATSGGSADSEPSSSGSEPSSSGSEPSSSGSEPSSSGSEPSSSGSAPSGSSGSAPPG